MLVAAADGILDKSEGDCLLQIGNKLDLTSEDVQSIAENLDVLSFVVASEGMQRTLELQTLVQMMLQDGTVR
ncbi:hypothetical protein SAMN00120144_0989 [Hymenobacter roseosalivarius DSM 11622]|uniref:Co-chaperone DjlA N-terminal domain-containing protein n=1 Tax=Hymenobacter roseosalivarius DSM 11622 TaxID=645990 RepID=A0A1W1V942_9BACT|nr:hypothetical protein SAMN00120144_0989 [Hymenobacter roseosalivarius DSM 11622]